MLYGANCELLNRYPAAADAYTRALRIDDRPELYVNRGMVLLHLGIVVGLIGVLLGFYLSDIALYRPSTHEWIYLRPDSWWSGKTDEGSAIHIRWSDPPAPGDEPAPGSYRFRLGG